MTKEEFSQLRAPIALVVDDEPLILMDTAEMIAQEGFTVIEAHSAQEAFEFLKQHPSLELLFTDVQTPGNIDGFELAQEVARRWPRIRIVITSGAAQPTRDSLPTRATFLAKPLLASRVREVVRGETIAIF